jgi:site-specific DNA-methyltransferase (adenine-specific)/adenine-specific DNA-methyltransferase
VEGDPAVRNRLIGGDNLSVIAALLAEGCAGRFDLVYIDPPFNVGADFRLPGGSRKRGGPQAPTAYSDRWGNGEDRRAASPTAAYLSMMLPRLAAIRELLCDEGTLWIHADWRSAAHLRLLADEVFGPGAFRGEVIWKHQVLGAGPSNLSKMHETLLRYARSASSREIFNPDAPEARVPFSDYILRTAKRDPDGRWYYERRAVRADDKGRNLKTYFDPSAGKPVGDVWLDLPSYQPPGDEKWGYPTQKPEALLRRIVALSSRPGGWVGDFFCGSGTTLAAAADLGRRFVGADASLAALHVAGKRLCLRERPVAFLRQQVASTEPEDAAPPPVRLVQRDGRALVTTDDSADFVAVDWSPPESGPPVYTSFTGRTRRAGPSAEIPAPDGRPSRGAARPSVWWADAAGNVRRGPAGAP